MATAKTRAATAKRVARLRKKKNPTDAERKEIEAWESEKKTKGRPRKKTAAKEKPPESESVPVDDSLAPPASLSSSDGPVGRPPPDPPPASLIPAAAKGKKGEEWIEKYRRKTLGREALCVIGADWLTNALWSMNEQIVELGGKPVMAKEQFRDHFFPAAVCTIHQVVPKHIEATPEMMVVGTTSATISKRLWYGWRHGKKKKTEQIAEDKARRIVAPPTAPAPKKPNGKPAADAPEDPPDDTTDAVVDASYIPGDDDAF